MRWAPHPYLREVSMAKQNETLFEESSQGAVSAITALVFIVSILLVFGGMVLMGYAFEGNPSDIWVFSGGLAAIISGFLLPFTVLGATGK